MKFIRWLILVIVIITIGYMVMDYLGYYIEWKIPAIALVVLAPIAQALRNFSQRPEKIFENDKPDSSQW